MIVYVHKLLCRLQGSNFIDVGLLKRSFAFSKMLVTYGAMVERSTAKSLKEQCTIKKHKIGKCNTR